MRAWIIQTGEPLPVDRAPSRGMRAMNLAAALNERGHHVTIWSADFSHQDKQPRTGQDACITISPLLDVRLIRSVGYQRNLGLRRIIDHAQLGRRFGYLAARVPAPDLAFVGFPPIEIAKSAVRHCRSRGVPCVLDIKDLWPDLFTDSLPNLLRPFADALLFPLHHGTRRAISDCDILCAPSEGFLDWASRKARRPRRESDIVAPLTAHRLRPNPDAVAQADSWWDDLGVLADGRPRAVFVGSMSRSFDLDCVIRAARSPAGQRWQWVLCGDGERRDDCRCHAGSATNILFPGWIDRPRIDSLLRRATVGLAPYRSIPNFELNICNKVYDYLEAGLPVVSPLRGDLSELLAREGVGRSHAPGDANALISAMETILPAEARAAMGAAAARLHGTRFEAGLAYARLAERLETLAMSRAKAASPPDSAHA